MRAIWLQKTVRIQRRIYDVETYP